MSESSCKSLNPFTFILLFKGGWRWEEGRDIYPMRNVTLGQKRKCFQNHLPVGPVAGYVCQETRRKGYEEVATNSIS